MNLSLCLSGGASRGAFHLGVLSFLEEQNIKINAYSGSSIGAVICASYASGVKAKEQLKIFKSKELKKSIKINPFFNGLLKIDMNNYIFEELLPVKNIEELTVPLYLCSYDLKNKQIKYFDKGNIKELCLASTAIFPLFKLAKYNNLTLLDGGLIDHLPVKPLKKHPYKILGIDLLPRKRKSNKKTLNPIKLTKRKIFKTWHEKLNYSISNTDYYLTSMELRNYKLFTFENLDTLFNLGYKEAENYFKKLK